MRDVVVVAILWSVACGGKKAAKQPVAEPAPAISNTVVEEPPPPPPPPPEPPPPATPCDGYFAAVAEMEAMCIDKIPPEAMAAMRQGRDAMLAAFADWDKLEPESRQAAVDAATTGCDAARDAILQVRTSLGCSASP